MGTQLVKHGETLTGFKQGHVVSVVLWKDHSGRNMKTRLRGWSKAGQREGTSQEDFVIVQERGHEAPFD